MFVGNRNMETVSATMSQTTCSQLFFNEYHKIQLSSHVMSLPCGILFPEKQWRKPFFLHYFFNGMNKNKVKWNFNVIQFLTYLTFKKNFKLFMLWTSWLYYYHHELRPTYYARFNTHKESRWKSIYIINMNELISDWILWVQLNVYKLLSTSYVCKF